MNWGTGITAFYILFAVGITTAVFASRKHAPVMVSKSYYELDIQYQKRMQKKINAATLPKGVEAKYDAGQRAVLMQFPVAAGTASGIVNVLCPSNPKADFNVPVKTDEKGMMSVPIPEGSGTLWRFETEWEAGGTPYFHEAVIYQ